ncbi:MAG: nucleoside deaminase [Hyphomicrobiales bacterium]
MNGSDIMRRVLQLARTGMDREFGYPYGCVIVKNGEVVGEAHNEVLATHDPTAHAELLAIRRASAKLQTHDLSGCELYTNATPCCMCMSSMLWANISRAYYILPEQESVSIGFGDRHFYDEVSRPIDKREIIPMVHLPSLESEALAICQEWVANHASKT